MTNLSDSPVVGEVDPLGSTVEEPVDSQTGIDTTIE